MSKIETVQSARVCQRLHVSRSELDWIQNKGFAIVEDLRLAHKAPPMAAVLTSLYAAMAAAAASEMPKEVIQSVLSEAGDDLFDLARWDFERWDREQREPQFTGALPVSRDWKI